MTNVKGYLIERDERSLFIRDLEEAAWAMEDSEYTVTALVPIDVYRSYEHVIEHHPQTDDTKERLELLWNRYMSLKNNRLQI